MTYLVFLAKIRYNLHKKYNMSFWREHVEKPILDVISKKRSKYWRKIRNQYVKQHPECAICGTTKSPEIHHIKDFSTYPELELETSNLITLCGKRCHFFFGHLLDWKSINPELIEDVEWMNQKIKNRR